MTEELIAEVGIDDGDRLYVRPSTVSFDHIHRAAMEVSWDASGRRLFGPRPKEWTYSRWFQQILDAAAGEYGVRLSLCPSTVWSNVPEALRAEIESLSL